MNVICQKIERIIKYIKDNNMNIICFGAGVTGRVTALQILKSNDLLDKLLFFIDNDEKLWDMDIVEAGYTYKILSPEILQTDIVNNSIIFLNVSRFEAVVEQLNSYNNLNDVMACITPMLCIHNFCLNESSGTHVISDERKIPPIIHYFWFGKKTIPDSLKRCIESWYKYCPDYEIVQWNEDNYDISKHPYMQQAYENGAYGFVPDYARLDILYNYGGFYLDTDVELIKSLDEMRYQESFVGVEKWQVLNFGGCSGAVKGNPMVGQFLKERESVYFIDANGNQNRNTCGYYDTRVAIRNGYILNGTTQCVNGMNIYAYDYFHPYDYMSGLTNITDNTVSIHHFNGGWLDDDMRAQNELTKCNYLKLYNESISS